MKLIENYIGGKFVRSNNLADVIDPTTGKTITQYCIADDQIVADAVNVAKTALTDTWWSMDVRERVDILYKVAEGITARFETFLEIECLDTGKPNSLAKHIDIPRGAENFKIFADLIKDEIDEAFHMSTADGAGAVNYTLRKPKGVIAIVGPWNLPLLLMTWKVGPALACGNTVVVKPSEHTNLSTNLLCDVMKEAGVPDGVFNVVLGEGSSVGHELIHNPNVDAITFTGSTLTGQKIAEAAADGIRDYSLELGGKNPGIIFADCEMDKAVEGTLRSAFANSGQVCLGTERLYVERCIFDEFVEKMKTGAEALMLGCSNDPSTNLGPLISEAHREKVLNYYQLAVDEGASVITGGGIPDMPDNLAGGYWVEPTIWTGLPENAKVIKEEIFGPCCHIAPFDMEDQAISMANDTPYGLASTVWTKNVSRAHRVAAQMCSGICWVNSWFLRDLRTPFGGAKQSGVGREGGRYSLDFYTELSNICIKF